MNKSLIWNVCACVFFFFFFFCCFVLFCFCFCFVFVCLFVFCYSNNRIQQIVVLWLTPVYEQVRFLVWCHAYKMDSVIDMLPYCFPIWAKEGCPKQDLSLVLRHDSGLFSNIHVNVFKSYLFFFFLIRLLFIYLCSRVWQLMFWWHLDNDD